SQLVGRGQTVLAKDQSEQHRRRCNESECLLGLELARVKNVTPVILGGVYLGMSGGGEIVYAIEEALEFILSGLVRILWVQGITRFVEERCDVPDKALFDQKLDKLFSQLPEEYVVPSTGGDFLIPKAIFLGSTTIRGLDRLEPDRPYKTFCRGQDKITLFSLRSRYPMRVSIPWSLCSGHNGTVVSNARTVRYEGELVTSKSVDGGTSSRIENLSTVQLESYDVGFRGSSIEELTPVVLEHLNIGMTGGGRTLHQPELSRQLQNETQDMLMQLPSL
ncbi:hypothetical protein HPB47_015057, partial [Ixodes persulcatus]